MSAVSKGGKSLYDNDEIIDLSVFDAVVGLSKTGQFTNLDLQKILAGKQVSTSIGLGEYSESIAGSSTPERFGNNDAAPLSGLYESE